MPKGRYPAQNAIAGILENGENNLPFLARALLDDLWQSIKNLNEEILKYDRKLYTLAKQNRCFGGKERPINLGIVTLR